MAYTFGHAGGVIVYSFPNYELPDARRDQLAVGIVTSQRSAVVVRVVSGSSSDFIEMELVRMQRSHAVQGRRRVLLARDPVEGLGDGSPPGVCLKIEIHNFDV